MKILRIIIIFIVGAMIVAPGGSVLSDPQLNGIVEPVISLSSPDLAILDESNTLEIDEEPTEPISTEQAKDLGPEEGIPANSLSPSPTPVITPDPIPNLYDCNMALNFNNGPLESKSTNFSVLGRDYFTDKGDKFAVGNGTAIYYEEQDYFILHSSYVNGNILKPMEAEFIRKYLENWGNTGEQYIQENIDQLIGSEATWTCNEDLTLTTTISGVVRLSHIASQRLWLEPQELPEILADQEGLASEWVGGIEDTDEPSILVGFCGWGPKSLDSGRYTYFRYLLQFTIDSTATN